MKYHFIAYLIQTFSIPLSIYQNVMVLYLLNDTYKLLHETSGISAFLRPGSFKQNPVIYRRVLQNFIFSICLRKKVPKMTMTFIVFLIENVLENQIYL